MIDSNSRAYLHPEPSKPKRGDGFVGFLMGAGVGALPLWLEDGGGPPGFRTFLLVIVASVVGYGIDRFGVVQRWLATSRKGMRWVLIVLLIIICLPLSLLGGYTLLGTGIVLAGGAFQERGLFGIVAVCVLGYAAYKLLFDGD